ISGQSPPPPPKPSPQPPHPIPTISTRFHHHPHHLPLVLTFLATHRHLRRYRKGASGFDLKPEKGVGFVNHQRRRPRVRDLAVITTKGAARLTCLAPLSVRLVSVSSSRVILFSIHSDEWKSFQSQHQSALRIRRWRYNFIPAESKFKTSCSIIKDTFMMKAQVHVSKSSAIYNVQALPQKKHY
nr:hypothetical protein [Tanacetum cinerariifolium]